jgi:DNA polymerase-3 subunit beta
MQTSLRCSTRCSIERPSLAAALKSITRFSGTHSPTHSYLPTLGNLLLKCSEGRLQITGTDLDSCGSVSVPCAGPAFSICVAPEALTQWLLQIKSEAIFVAVTDPADTDQDRLEFSANGNRSKISLPGLPADQFPALPKAHTTNADATNAHWVSVALFREAVQSVLPFAPKPSRRACGRTAAVHFHVADQSLIVAACDGVRFNKREVQLVSRISAQGQLDEGQFAVSPTALTNLLKLLSESGFDGELSISRDDKTAWFRASTSTVPTLLSVSTRLLDTQLDIEKLQANFDVAAGSFTVDTKVLTRALRRLSRIAKQDKNRVEFHTGQGIVQVCTRSDEAGHAVEEVPADVSGEPTQIAFDSKQLADVLKTVKADKVLVEYQANPRKVARIAGVLIVPVEAFAVEEARRLAKRAAAEAIAAAADMAALADAVERQIGEWQRRSVFVDVAQAVFKGLDQFVGNNSTWPEALQKLPHDLKTQVRQRIGDELLERGVLQCNEDIWQVESRWADARFEPGEAERREQARAALREGVQESIKNLRSSEKIDYAKVILEWHCSAQVEPFPYRSELSFTDASDVRSRVTKVLNTVRSRFEPEEQGGGDEQ